uniref:UL128 n=1 Tax=Macrostomum lignano TaxID=282301 RepID=A0A1I8HDH3_9PLAT
EVLPFLERFNADRGVHRAAAQRQSGLTLQPDRELHSSTVLQSHQFRSGVHRSSAELPQHAQPSTWLFANDPVPAQQDLVRVSALRQACLSAAAGTARCPPQPLPQPAGGPAAATLRQRLLQGPRRLLLHRDQLHLVAQHLPAKSVQRPAVLDGTVPYG